MPKRLVLLLSASTLLLLAALVGGVYAIAVFVESVTISPTLSDVSLRIALSGAFLAGAVLLYVAKNSRYQFGYGLLEVAVGLVFNWQSLDSWFHSAVGTVHANFLYARLTIIVAGTYLMSRGISNVIDGFLRFFPVSWHQLFPTSIKKLMSDAWVEGYYKPYNAQTKNLKWQIISAQSDIDKREKKLKTAIKTGKDTKSLQRQLDLLREGLRIAT